jgi:xanthine dehydrogenase accessory factor
MKPKGLVVLIKGGGEVAIGVAHRLFQAHFRVCLTEVARPQAVSRGVTCSEAVYDNEKEIEGITGILVDSLSGIRAAWAGSRIPVIVDPEAKVKDALKPDVFVVSGFSSGDRRITQAWLRREMASLEGFEPTTRCLEGSRSIH